MVVISEIQIKEDSSEIPGVNVVKGQASELENSSEDETDMAEKDDVFVINLMGNEDHIAFEAQSDGDDSAGDEESEEMFDDDDGDSDNEIEEEMSNGSGSDDVDGDDSDISDVSNAEEEEEPEPAAEGTGEKSEMDIVKDVLEKAAKEAGKNESIAVSKHIDLEFDLGTLLAVDTNELDFNLLRNSTEDYLKNLARDNTQLLINNIWQLTITRKETEIVAKLPNPTYKLPREKPIPKPKPLTKWQQFAQEKGIVKHKKSKKEWDETLQKWIPRYGYLKYRAERDKKWLIETKKNDDPMADPYAKLSAAKQERVAKNELQRLRNLAKANNIKVPRGDKLKLEALNSKGDNQRRKGKRVPQNLKKSSNGKKEPVPRAGFLTSDMMDSVKLKQAVTISRSSTASLGKFQSRFSKEKDAKNVGSLMPMAKKRRAPFANVEQERQANLKVVDGILKKRPKLDLEKAVNRHINDEQRQRAEEKSQKPKGKGRGKVKRSGGGGGSGKKNNLKGRGQGKVKMGNKGSKGKPKRRAGKKR